MSALLLTNATLAGARSHTPELPLSGLQLNELPQFTDQYLLIEDGLIAAYGPMSEAPTGQIPVRDVRGRFVLPAWCDSHTHLVYAASREQEFEMRLHGRTYEEIAAAGGGIINSAMMLRAMDESELYDRSYQRFVEVQRQGTGAIEIKSGYGLDEASELKMLRVIRRLKETNEIPVKATFLGAHAIPPEYKQDRRGYLRLMLEQVLPKIAGEGLADYIDVFCDTGFFTPGEAKWIMEAGAKYGLPAKIHANELAASGGVEAGVSMNALSVDHLEEMDDASINALAQSSTIGTMLPGCAFFLGIPYPQARKMIQAGATLALASDYNPGTAPSGNMNFVLSLACVKLKMTPAEAINAATLNGAFAMQQEPVCGSITPGKLANLLITRPISSVGYLAYHFGSPAIENVLRSGKII